MIRVMLATADVGRINGRQWVGKGEALRPSTTAATMPCGAGTLPHHTLASRTPLLDRGEAPTWKDAYVPPGSFESWAKEDGYEEVMVWQG